MANFRKTRKAPAKELGRCRLPLAQLLHFTTNKNEGVSRT